MTKYEKIFEALAQFDIVLTNSEIDDFETCLKEQGLKIVELKTMLDLLEKLEVKALSRNNS